MDESFESSRPFTEERVTVRTDPAVRGNEAEEQAEPSLEDAIEKIPAEHRRLLEELFGARFTSVRRIDPEQLR